MNNFEDKIKHISKQDFNVPKKYENSVNDALNYISNISKEKSNKKNIKNNIISIMQKVAIVFITGILGVTVYAGISNNAVFQKIGLNKLSQNYEQNKVSVDQTIENDYFTLSLENIARDSAYVILEYNIHLKDKAINEFEEVTYSEIYGEYAIGPACTITVNGEENPFSIVYTDKESDSDYSYYQIINVMNYDDENLDLKIWFDYLWTGNYLNETVQINETLNISSKLSNIEDNFEKQEQKLDDGSTIILDKIANVNFQTFVRIKRTVSSIAWKEYNNSNALQYKSFLITDSNNNLIPYRTYTSDIIGRKYYLAETGEVIENISEIKDDDKITVEENYVILLDNIEDTKNIKIFSIKLGLYDDRTDEESKMYNNAIWYPLAEGNNKYSALSNLGGTLEIDNIKIDDENITFHYTKNGIVENGISYVLIRNKNKTMNYVCPSNQDETNSGDITFSRKILGTGLGVVDGMLDNIEDLEFTLMFSKAAEYDGIPFETSIPELSIQEVKIDSINKEDTNTATIEFESGSNKCEYVIDYDNENNILKFSGDLNRLTYRENNKFNSIRVGNYEKSTDLIEEIEEHLKFKNIEYTIQYE
jgi:hypothetical protein